MESLLRVDRSGLETLIPSAMCSRRVWTHSEVATPSVSVNELDLVIPQFSYFLQFLTKKKKKNKLLTVCLLIGERCITSIARSV